MDENQLRVRHFILCKRAVPGMDHDNSTFDVQSVYEYFAASDYPCVIENVEGVVGVYFLQPGNTYHLRIDVVHDQTGEKYGYWDFPNLQVDKKDDILNIFFKTSQLYLYQAGLIRFDIYVGDTVIDQQYVLAVQEGEREC